MCLKDKELQVRLRVFQRGILTTQQPQVKASQLDATQLLPSFHDGSVSSTNQSPERCICPSLPWRWPPQSPAQCFWRELLVSIICYAHHARPFAPTLWNGSCATCSYVRAGILCRSIAPVSQTRASQKRGPWSDQRKAMAEPSHGKRLIAGLSRPSLTISDEFITV